MEISHKNEVLIMLTHLILPTHHSFLDDIPNFTFSCSFFSKMRNFIFFVSTSLNKSNIELAYVYTLYQYKL